MEQGGGRGVSTCGKAEGGARGGRITGTTDLWQLLDSGCATCSCASYVATEVSVSCLAVGRGHRRC
jgi:hypothetical protein